jgi:hypothetical protein
MEGRSLWTFRLRRATEQLRARLPNSMAAWQKLAGQIAFEVLIVAVFLKAYNMVRNQFGSTKCTPEFALGHAHQVIAIERALGMFWEQEIQVWRRDCCSLRGLGAVVVSTCVLCV